MKQFLLLTCLSLFSIGLTAQTVFVDADATGNNDGTSWADAFVSLDSAITAAADSSVLWIADGTYTTPDSASFYINKQLTLLGGFDGTETMASAADPDANVTILSGDVAGDDVTTGFDSLTRLDNNRIMILEDTNAMSAFTVTIDGLTFQDGAGPPRPEDVTSTFGFSAGALWSTARVNVSRVKFNRNSAEFAPNLFVQGGNTFGSTFDQISTENTYTPPNGRGLFRLVNTADISLTNSEFTTTGEQMTTGFFRLTNVANVTVDSCVFEDLTALDGTSFGFDLRGAAMNFADGIGISITNCTFRDLTGALGGALNFDNDVDFYVAVAPSFDTTIIENNTFERISSIGWGGTVFSSDHSYTFRNNVIDDVAANSSTGLGAGVYAQGRVLGVTDDSTFENSLGYVVESNTFNNITNLGPFSGGAGFFFGELSTIRIMDNVVTNCVAETGSGFAIQNGEAVVMRNSFTNCGNNTTAFRGAGLSLNFFQPLDSYNFLVEDCTFEDNILAQESGIVSGGTGIYVSGSDFTESKVVIRNVRMEDGDSEPANGALYLINSMDLELDNVDFINNLANNGGAISTRLFTTTLDTFPDGSASEVFYPVQNVTGDRVLFYNNSAAGQGGAINVFNTNIDFTNSIFASNKVNFGGGSGGAIILNGAGADFVDSVGVNIVEATLTNNTFYNNLDGGREMTAEDPASIGDNIAIFQPGGVAAGDSNYTVLTLLNNAMLTQAGEDAESIGIELNASASDPTGFGRIDIVSLGGNFFNGVNDDQLTITGAAPIVDLMVESADLFVDPEADDSDLPNFRLTGDASSNPLIDAGVDTLNAPDNDFYGGDRTAAGLSPIDIGAVESDAISDVAEPIENSGLAVSFFPNPTVDRVNIAVKEAGITSYELILTNVNGQLIGRGNFTGALNSIDVTQLPAGVYTIQMVVDGNAYSKQIVKQ